MRVRVNAKINLTLDVVGLYGEGYHDLDMIMASCGIYDVVEVTESDRICVTMDGRESNEGNTAYAVAKICHEEYGVPCLNVQITKGIPFGAGLGGSSADASAVLYCVSKMYGLPDEDIRQIAGRVGSDVNFILRGGLCRACGKGDDLQPLPFREYSLVVVKGRKSARTKDVFETFDKQGKITNYTEQFLAELNKSDLPILGNGLQPAAQSLCADIAVAAEVLSGYSSNVCMTGSGSAVFAVVRNMDEANNLADLLSRKFAFVKACTTLPYGVREM